MKSPAMRAACALLLSAVVVTAEATSNPSADAASPEEIANVVVDGDSIIYHGPLTKQAVTQVAGFLKENPSLNELSIDSPGGSMDLGMDLGELVHRYQLDVRASGQQCSSSCANYVFAAGKRKFIDPGTLVIWHGSASQKNWSPKVEVEGPPGVEPNAWQRWQIKRFANKRLSEYLARIRKRQATFYGRIGVDARVTMVGQDLDCKCQWTLIPEDMAAFGITDVQAEQDYGTHPGRFDGDWSLIRLADHPGYLRK